MLIRTVELRDPILFHARPAAWIASEAKKYESVILFTADGQMADAKKPLSIMRLGDAKDRKVEIISDGSDETEAMQAMVEILENVARDTLVIL